MVSASFGGSRWINNNNKTKSLHKVNTPKDAHLAGTPQPLHVCYHLKTRERDDQTVARGHLLYCKSICDTLDIIIERIDVTDGRALTGARGVNELLAASGYFTFSMHHPRMLDDFVSPVSMAVEKYEHGKAPFDRGDKLIRCTDTRTQQNMV